MKNFLLVVILSLSFSSTSFAEWKKVAKGTEGENYYLDTSSIEKNNGYVYFWILIDYLKPDKWGDLSSKHLYETDCQIPLKIKMLSGIYYNGHMASGKMTTILKEKMMNDMGQLHTPPGSSQEAFITTACNF